MKAYISWSGDLSRKVATTLQHWLTKNIYPIQILDIETDIQIGQSWKMKIDEVFQSTELVIFCVTRNSLNSHWFTYELGYFTSKSNTKAIIPLLVDVEPSEVHGPIAYYQFYGIDNNSIHKLVSKIKDISRSKTGLPHYSGHRRKLIRQHYYFV